MRAAKGSMNARLMHGEYRFALAPKEQKAFKGFLDQAVVRYYSHYCYLVTCPSELISFLCYTYPCYMRSHLGFQDFRMA
ncbi:hypothetical protein OSTOST_08645 [Ostertagia ostertagi]